MAATNIADMIKAGAKIIDVRTPEEFAEGAYPGAINIPLNEIPAKMNELGPKDNPYIIYCASGMRSGQAVKLLKKAGFIDAVNAGGFEGMPR
jgi:phage shock protein E